MYTDPDEPGLLARLMAELKQNWAVQERPFVSQVPIVGRLIVAVRNAWNSVATKWYVRPLLQQQNEFNHLVAQHLEQYFSILETQQLVLTDQEEELSSMARDLAEMAVQLRQLNRRLETLARQLDPGGPGDGAAGSSA